MKNISRSLLSNGLFVFIGAIYTGIDKQVKRNLAIALSKIKNDKQAIQKGISLLLV